MPLTAFPPCVTVFPHNCIKVIKKSFRRLRLYKSHVDDDLYVHLVCGKSSEAELWQCTVVFKELRITCEGVNTIFLKLKYL